MLPSTNQTQSASELLASSVQQRLERSRSGKVHPEPDPRHRYTLVGWSYARMHVDALASAGDHFLNTDSQDSKEGDGSTRLPRRPRNCALTWEVPPPLELQPAAAASSHAASHQDGEDSGRIASGRAAVHPLVTLHQSAFRDAADDHLRAIVQQLLGGEEAAVSVLIAPCAPSDPRVEFLLSARRDLILLCGLG